MPTTKKYIKSLEKLGKEVINLDFYIAPYDYQIMINSKAVGAVLDNRCYLILTKSLKALLPNAKIYTPLNQGINDYIEFSDMENSALFSQCLKAVYDDLYFDDEFVLDVFTIYHHYQNYPAEFESIYDKDVLFLKFCFENGLLKLNPLDNKNRIIKSYFVNSDLTELGQKIFDKLHNKFLSYGDKTKNPNYEKMLPKWLDELTNNKE